MTFIQLISELYGKQLQNFGLIISLFYPFYTKEQMKQCKSLWSSFTIGSAFTSYLSVYMWIHHLIKYQNILPTVDVLEEYLFLFCFNIPESTTKKFNVSCYRSGTVNSNTVNSKFHLIRSYCKYLATILSFHV